MWEILSNHTTQNLLIQATITSSHAAVEKRKIVLWRGNAELKCIASTSGPPDKLYSGTAEGDFTKPYQFLQKLRYKWRNPPSQSMFWKKKQRHNITPTLKWYTIKSVPSYSNITKSCMLCIDKKFEIPTYPNLDELLNKRSELVSICCHINKYLLSNYEANDWHSV